MSYTVTYKGKTFNEYQTEINALTLRDEYKTIFGARFPNSTYENVRLNLNGENFYNSFRSYQLVNGSKVYDAKPAYSEIEADLSQLKADKLAEITDIFDDLQFREDTKSRIESLTYWLEACHEVDTYPTPNSRKELMDLVVQTRDLVYLTAVETAHATIAASKTFESNVAERQKRIVFGQRLIAVISQLNEDNNITVAQTQTIFASASVQQIIGLLQNGALETARGAIQALDITGLDPVDESYKTELINRINDYLGL